MILVIIIVLVYGGLFLTMPLITILHELGHAFAYLILTRPDKIEIYIGSYGDTRKTVSFRISKLHFYIKNSFPFVKGIGLCKSYKAENNYVKAIVIVIAGSVFTLFAALLIGILAFNSNIHGAIKLYCFALIIFSVISLVANLSPRTIKRSENGDDLDNDGKKLLFIIKLRSLYANYIKALQLIANHEFHLAINELLYVLKKFPGEEKILRSIIFASIYAKHYDEAVNYIAQLEEKYELSTIHILHKACMQSMTNKHDDSIPNYRLVLERDADNLIALNNLGYVLAEKGQYEEPKKLLERAIKINPAFYAAYNSLGYLEILNGNLNAGKMLVDKAIESEPENAYAYKSLGIYYLKLSDESQSAINFQKAKELDGNINLDSYFN